MGLCCSSGANHYGKQYCQIFYFNSHISMLTPDQYYVPDNGDGGIGEEEQVKTA